MTDNVRACARCGQPAEGPDHLGLCPDCLLAAGLGSAADATAAGAVPRFTPPAPEELAPLFPQLEIEELIGSGGMGAVYRARQKNLDRPVALKILPPDIGGDPAFAARFAREARALARLNHPNIVTLYEFGQVGELFFFLMEYVDGASLRQVIRDGRVSPREALAIVPQLCDALQYAHDQGVVHRDIKPENILLDRLGRVKVADFGVAKIVWASDRTDQSDRTDRKGRPADGTLASLVMGTPAYMAPEQRERPSEVDHRADIYSLGVVFYQMLTGELPGSSLVPPSRRVAVDVRLDEVVLRALEQRPERRYQQASEVKTVCETIAVGAPPAPRPWQAPSAGWGWLVGRVFGLTFTSPAAYACANLSALGFLGALGFLSALPLPGAQHASCLYGLFGFLGLIGLAHLVELGARLRRGRTPPLVGGRCGDAVSGAALGSFALSYGLLLVLLWHTAGELPARVATHFGAEGAANGWMTRGGYLAYLAAMPLALGAVLVGVSALVRRLPARYVNLPRKDYWLAPERRAQTSALLRNYMLVMACLVTLFYGGLHVLGVQANLVRPPQLPMGGMLAVMLAFLLALMLWIVALLMRFAETGEGAAFAEVRPAPRPSAPPTSDEAVRREVRRPATGLLITALLSPFLPGALVAAGRLRMGAWMLWPYLFVLAGTVVAAYGALRMRRLESYRSAVAAGVAGCLISFFNLCCLPFAVWALAVLSRRSVREGFGLAEPSAGGAGGRQRLEREGSAPAGRPRPRWRKKALECVAGVAIALALRQWVVGAYTIKNDTLAPELPAGSYVLAWKLARTFSPGDLVIYREGDRYMAGRVSGVGGGAVDVNRNGATVTTLDPRQLTGTIISILWRAGRKASAATAPAEAPVSKAVAAAGVRRLELTNGVSAEVVAVCRNPRQAPAWWSPDGTRLDEPPADIVGMRERSPDSRVGPENEFLVCLRWASNGRYTQVVSQPPQSESRTPVTIRDRSSGKTYSIDMLCYQEPPASVALSVATTADSLAQEVATFDGTATRSPLATVVCGQPAVSGDSVWFDVAHNVDLRAYVLRLTARLRDGRQVDGELIDQGGRETVRAKARVHLKGFAAADVKEYVFSRVPWVRGIIPDVALTPRPGKPPAGLSPSAAARDTAPRPFEVPVVP